jgi:hypothetical protein
MRRSGNMMLSQVNNNYLCCAIKVITARGLHPPHVVYRFQRW